MSKQETDFEFSRRGLLQIGSAALVGAGISCTHPSETAKTQPAEGENATPKPATETAKPIAGTAPNTAFSKEYVQMVGRFAYLWAWPMVNSFNRRTAMVSV